MLDKDKTVRQKDIEKHKRAIKSQFRRNLVAKQSRNKSGAGPHKSTKDYDRHDKEYQKRAIDLVGIQQSIDELISMQAITKGASEWAMYEAEIDELKAEMEEIKYGRSSS